MGKTRKHKIRDLGLMENKRFAIDIGVNLSGQLINASLSMLAIIGALFIFIIDKREISMFFYILMAISFLSFVISIFLGGKGINKIREKSFKDKLDLKCSKDFFNYQAILCIIGILTCLLSFLFTQKNDAELNQIKVLNENLEKIIESNSIQNSEIKLLENKIKYIEQKFDSLIETKPKKTVPNIGYK